MCKEANENIGHFLTPKATVEMQPLGNRTDSAHEPKNRQLHVALGNGAILNPPSSTLRNS